MLNNFGKSVFKKFTSIKFLENVNLVRNFSLSKSNYLQFVQFSAGNNSSSLGILINETDIVSLNVPGSSIPSNLVDFLVKQDELRTQVQSAINERKEVHKVTSVKLLPPITRPDKVICVGLNYKGHCDEQNKPYPEQPFFFPKFPSTIIGPDEEIPHPPNSKALDWEVELAVVVGKRARNVPLDKAYEYVFGYTIAQDISARDWQTPKRNNGQWLVAKSMDRFCPLGPSVVTKDVIPDPHTLNISCSINGVRKQNGNTNELIHRVDKLISFLSELFSLLPGDVILTGTPSGVGVFRNPREFLKPNDVIVSEISSIGKLTNRIV